MPRITAFILTCALALTGCSGGSPVDSIKVGGTAAKPSLTVPKDFSVDETSTKVIKQGTGPKVDSGDTVKLDFIGYNGRTGKRFDNSFVSGNPLTVELTKDKAIPGFIKAVQGQRVGTRLVSAIPPVDGFAAERPEIGLLKSDTMVFYLRVASKIPAAASGKKQALPADVPAVVLKDDQPAGFRKTASTQANLPASSAHVAIKGTGPKVPKGGTVVAHYVGQVYPQGDVFDSSWSRGAPATFPLTTVIKCWQNLLPGVRVGSRVILECTAADAYGDSPQPGGPIKPGDSLLFAIDILDAQ